MRSLLTVLEFYVGFNAALAIWALSSPASFRRAALRLLALVQIAIGAL